MIVLLSEGRYENEGIQREIKKKEREGNAGRDNFAMRNPDYPVEVYGRWCELIKVGSTSLTPSTIIPDSLISAAPQVAKLK